MKLITLNIWGGHVREPLLNFIRKYQDIDIFCFQEVYHNAKAKFSTDDKEASLNIFSEVCSLLPAHQPYFRPVIGKMSGNAYGIAMFVKKGIDVLNEGDIVIHDNPDYPKEAPNGYGPRHSRNLQWIECCEKNSVYTIMNVHGLWNGQGKNDTPERITQSANIQNFINKISTAKVLCGDFNLRPETKSLAMVKERMQNLVETYKVPTTRTKHYTKRQQEPFADYIFTCPKIDVNSFEVLLDEVSDHAPLLLDFKHNLPQLQFET